MIGQVTGVQAHRDKTSTVSIRISPAMLRPGEGGICVMLDPYQAERAVRLPTDTRHDLEVLQLLPRDEEQAVTCAQLAARLPRMHSSTIAGCLKRLRNNHLAGVRQYDPRRPLRYHRTITGQVLSSMFADMWPVVGAGQREEIDRLHKVAREQQGSG